MIARPQPRRDDRDLQKIVAELFGRRPGYVKQWQPPDKSAGAGLALIFARYLQTIAQRLNQTPEKNKLASLDLLGLRLGPAQEARVPVVFQLSGQASAGSAPAGTGLAAPAPPGSTEQIAFETERAAGVAAGKIAQVFSLWPGRDEYIDHSAAFLAGQPIQLFQKLKLQPTPHILYLSHSTLLALAGNVNLGVEFELTHGSTNPLEIIWEYWDGQVWRSFLTVNPSCLPKGDKTLDSTNGLTSSGAFQLLAECAESSQTTVSGSKGYWIRGRLNQPLPPDPGQTLPEVESIRLSSTVTQPLKPSLTASLPYSPPDNTPGGLVLFLKNEAGQTLTGATITLTNPSDPAFGRPPATEAPSLPGVYQSAAFTFGINPVLEVSFGGLEGSVQAKQAPTAQNRAIDLFLAVDGLKPDKALADGTVLDVTKPFFPFGQQPQPGSTFYFTSKEAFTKPDAKLRVYVATTKSPQDEAAITAGTQSPDRLEHSIAWEYWNGRQWVLLAQSSDGTNPKLDFNVTEVIDLPVPVDMAPTTVNDQEALWMRARLISGGFGFKQTVQWLAGGTTGTAHNQFTYVIAQPPALATFRLGYTWQYGPFHADQVLAFNDFQYEDRTYEARWPGTTFFPYQRVSDVTPALYLGLDKKPPVDQIGLYFDIVEKRAESKGPALVWEYWDGFAWRGLSIEDETNHLRLPGIASFIAQNDATALARFGTALYWVRARLKEDGPPGEPTINGIFLNAVWASQRRTLTDVALGASTGVPDQIFLITQTPVLAGERIEVRELAGPRANVEWRILAMELFQGDHKVVTELEGMLAREGVQTDVVKDDLRLRRDRTKKVTEVWVRWESQPHLFFSKSADRHYQIDRARGRLLFGDGINGKVPPPGAAILARELRTGGGAAGNVAARAVNQLLGVVQGVEAVFNPRPAEGGADGESLEAFSIRGPQTVRHRGRAIAPSDYETLARETSAAVAVARALPTRNPAGRPLPGWTTLLIIPESREPRPYPSFGLRQEVARFLEARAPADLTAAGHLDVTGPDYLPVDVAATIAPLRASEAGIVEKKARQALEEFLHPLRGGPGGEGWELGRDVFLSDVAAVLERVEGMDYIEELTLLLDGAPQGERVPVAEDRIVVAGNLELKVKAAER